jgi:butyrate kinase
MDSPKILVINPGSTSTKIAVYQDTACLMQHNIKHFLDELVLYPTIISQFEFRKDLIEGTLEMEGFALNEIKIVMGRGGLTYPLESGVYEVDERMLTHVRKGILGQHASNLGPLLSHAIAKEIPGAKAYIADPVVTDELEKVARISGHPRFERRSIFHALNQKAVCRMYAKSISKSYEELKLIVVHMGGGVSIGAHFNGRVIDVNNALDGEGPFSPERSGTLPAGQLIEACFCGNFTEDEMKLMVTGEGGMVAYLDTNNMIEVIDMAEEGDENAQFYIEAFVYQVAKAVGEMATVLKGKVDAILITGGIAYSTMVTNLIKERVGFISRIEIFAGEDELAALAMNAYMLLKGELIPKKYPH